MKNKKQLKKLVRKMIEESIKDGILQEKKVLAFIKEIKKLHLAKALYLLNEYKKALGLEMSKHTLVVESSMKLSSAQLNNIKGELKNMGKIVKTENKINPNLIAGIRVKLGDVIFDDSIKSRINQLKGAIIHG
ncbi:F0F1 ATP synthase subunit delta [Candidatus Daviesbacteria bacterium]|nr:F0F1 ATP synthase subunit delta [Candidatus Daviesbacteria bacterium]